MCWCAAALEWPARRGSVLPRHRSEARSPPAASVGRLSAISGLPWYSQRRKATRRPPRRSRSFGAVLFARSSWRAARRCRPSPSRRRSRGGGSGWGPAPCASCRTRTGFPARRATRSRYPQPSARSTEHRSGRRIASRWRRRVQGSFARPPLTARRGSSPVPSSSSSSASPSIRRASSERRGSRPSGVARRCRSRWSHRVPIHGCRRRSSCGRSRRCPRTAPSR